MLSTYSKNIIRNIQNFIDQKLFKLTPIESYDFFKTGVYSYGHKIVPTTKGGVHTYILYPDNFVRYYDYSNNKQNDWHMQNYKQMPLLVQLGSDIKKQTMYDNNVIPYVELFSFINVSDKHKDLKIKAILKHCSELDDDYSDFYLTINDMKFIVIKITLQNSAYSCKDIFENVLSESDIMPPDDTDDCSDETEVLMDDLTSPVIDAEPLF